MSKVKVIAEIGINHNGSIEKCKELIMLAKVSGCDYAKIQKRNPDICVPEHQKTKRRKYNRCRFERIEKDHISTNSESIRDQVYDA